MTDGPMDGTTDGPMNEPTDGPMDRLKPIFPISQLLPTYLLSISIKVQSILPAGFVLHILEHLQEMHFKLQIFQNQGGCPLQAGFC